MQPIPMPTREGPGHLDDAARLQRRLYQAWLRQGGLAGRRRIALSPIDVVLIACLSLCLFAIGLGLDRMYPVVRPSLHHALREDLPRRPFPDCDAAHAAGVFSIPRGSAAYTVHQDGNGNGLACEPG
jgi:hypothetical protein